MIHAYHTQGQRERKSYMAVDVDMKALLEAGAHFGHKTSRWHPKMAPYIHSKRQSAHIINLEKTVEGLEKALPKAGVPFHRRKAPSQEYGHVQE